MLLSNLYYKSLHKRRQLRRKVNKILPRQGPPLKMLVVGSPRSGFQLLTQSLIVLSSYGKWGRHEVRDRLQEFMPRVSSKWYPSLGEFMGRHYGAENIFVSGEFSSLLGGPKWVDPQNTGNCVVRKYIGVRGVGDLTLNIHMPKQTLDFYEVVHTHYNPSLWVGDDYFGGHDRFASIRHPADCITSAMFSLNALTSEYLIRNDMKDHMQIRETLGLSKLSDPNFFKGIMTHYLKYYKDFLEVRDQYKVIRWEDMTSSPAPTIKKIADLAGIEISDDVPARIWDYLQFLRGLASSRLIRLLDYVRPTYHKHNVWLSRKDHWKERLPNEYYEMFIEAGFNEVFEELGYEKVKPVNEKDYTEFQRKVSGYLKKGEIFKGVDDADLSMFAFNKSNIDSSAYDFISRPFTGRVQIERSSIKDQRFLEELERLADDGMKPVWDGIQRIIK